MQLSDCDLISYSLIGWFISWKLGRSIAFLIFKANSWTFVQLEMNISNPNISNYQTLMKYLKLWLADLLSIEYFVHHLSFSRQFPWTTVQLFLLKDRASSFKVNINPSTITNNLLLFCLSCNIIVPTILQERNDA